MIKQILFATLILINLSSYCQSDYPKKAIIDNDTIVMITPGQVTKLNLAFNDLDRFKMKSDSLSSLISLFEQHDSLKDKVIQNQRLQMINYEKQGSINEEIILSLDKEVKKQKRYRNIGFGTSVLLLILLIVK